MRIIPRILIAALIYVATWWLFTQVVPDTPAMVLAAVLALVELFAPLVASGTGGRSGPGGGIRALFKMGTSITAWPVLALGLEYAGMADRPARIALAAAAAAALGAFAARHGNGRDSMRVQAVLVAVAMPLYGIGQAITVTPLDPLALALACGGIAVALLVARYSILWPRQHEGIAMTLAGACLVAGGLCALPLFV